MIGKTPYIIVDDQIIQPISRSPRPESAAGEPGRKQEQNFGVADRVTISREGREKARQQANIEERELLVDNRREQLTARRHPMLTYSPNGQREP